MANGHLSEYAELDGIALAQLVSAGEVSASELLDEALARADAHNPALNAIVLRLDEMARAAIDTGLPGGPFAGVPFLLKDLSNALAGVPRSSGSRFFRDYVPDFDLSLIHI